MTPHAKAVRLMSKADQILNSRPNVDLETLRFDIVMPLCKELLESTDAFEICIHDHILVEMIYSRIGKLQKLAGLQE